jgi:WhiB family transcriptional regulator, redox-sensing transcriptional regulator
MSDVAELWTMLTVQRAWMAQARCVGRSELFFPTWRERPGRRRRREAKARELCAGCPVRDACRAHARDHREYGIWGGETEEERLLGVSTPTPTPVGWRPRRAELDREEAG